MMQVKSYSIPAWSLLNTTRNQHENKLVIQQSRSEMSAGRGASLAQLQYSPTRNDRLGLRALSARERELHTSSATN